MQEIYSDLENSSQSFEIRSAIRNNKQGNSNVTDYFNTLVELWHEMVLFYTIAWENAADSIKYNKMVEKDLIFDFLYGLNSDLDEVCGRILGTKPLPTLREVFAELRREESRCKVMLQSADDLAHQHSALVTVKQGEFVQKDAGREKQWCDHC